MKRFVALAGLLLLTGCDTVVALRRSAPASYLPPVEEVREVVSHVPGVMKVEVTAVPASRTPSLRDENGRSPAGYELSIHGEAASTLLALGTEPGKKISFHTLWMNRQPTAAEFAHATALMDRIYDALLAKFPRLPARSEFNESGPARP